MKYLFSLLFLLIPVISFGSDYARVYYDYDPDPTHYIEHTNFTNLSEACKSYTGGACLTQEQANAIEDGFMLEDALENKKEELNQEAKRRANIYYPDAPIGVLKLAKDLYTVILSPQPNDNLTAVGSIDNARTSIISTINGFDNISAINAFNSFTGLP